MGGRQQLQQNRDGLWSKRITWLYITLGITLLLGVAVWLLPWGIRVSRDWATLQQDSKATAKEKFDASLQIAQAMIGSLGTVATIAAGIVLYLNFRIANRNTEIAESHLITERFSKAVEQLGNDKIEVRLGGIYALERIAADSDRYHWVVIEILASFIQEKSPQKLIPQRFVNLIAGTETPDLPKVDELPRVVKDVQAALTVIGRRDAKRDPADKYIALNETNLSARTQLVGANFKNACLWETHIIQSDLKEANLSGADLEAAALSLSDLRMANLSGAYLVQADLRKTNLRQADLSQANLTLANLGKADLQQANLRWAVGLTPQQIKQAQNWERAIYDDDFREQLNGSNGP